MGGNMKGRALGCALLLSIAICFGKAEYTGPLARLIPNIMNYQGYLTDTLGVPIDDTLDMTFKIFDAVSGGNELWSETIFDVPVERGIFSVLLGSSTLIPDSVFAEFSDTWLEITLEGPQTLTPRTRITAVGYAYTSTYSDTAQYSINAATDSDWTISGSDMYSAVSGNVGIGLPSPSYKLHVNGTTRIESDLYMNNSVIHNVQNLDIGQVQGYGIRFYSLNNYAINFGGYGEFAYGPVTQYSIKMNTADASGYGWVWGVDGQTPIAALSSTGTMQLAENLYVIDSIGIGTTAPSQELDINGNMHLSGAIYDGNNEAGTSGQVLSTVGSGTDWVDAPADNDWTISGNVLYPSAAYGLSMRSGNVLYGNYDSTHVNFGVACTTGSVSTNYKYCTVGGGYFNKAGDYYATVGGGYANIAQENFATVAGGYGNNAADYASAVGGGRGNTATTDYSTVAGGYGNTATDYYAFIGGGYYNTADYYATATGGYSNDASGYAATVAGGYNSTASGNYSFVGGGAANNAAASYATVLGGYNNYASGYGAVVAGSTDSVLAYCGGVLSGISNVAGDAATDTAAVVAGGWDNIAHSQGSFIGGGRYNTADSWYPTVAGGYHNTAGGYGAVGGGYYNHAASWHTVVAGGNHNTAYNLYSAVGGGLSNYAYFDFSTVPGGYGDSALSTRGFCTNYSTYVAMSYDNASAFNTSHATASNQVRANSFSSATMVFTMDHPDDPMNKILNQHAVGADDAMFMYSGSTVLDADGRAVVNLPDYFDDINRNPRIQLTGVGTYEIYVAEKISENRFVVGGKPGTEVYWTVIAERKDMHAEIARILTPVEQQKTGDLIGHSLDDDGLVSIYNELEEKRPGFFHFKTAEGQRVHEQGERRAEHME
jgi:hypothetical protein